MDKFSASEPFSTAAAYAQAQANDGQLSRWHDWLAAPEVAYRSPGMLHEADL
ncbi:MAG: hypothetical protein IPM39_21665 [Chloroflexi bacterium]|nr:hypothetical protein [Chloroflexota bacterium]